MRSGSGELGYVYREVPRHDAVLVCVGYFLHAAMTNEQREVLLQSAQGFQ